MASDLLQRIRRWFGPAPASLGQRGEQLAAEWLKRRGYRILKRNYKVHDDEADLIALDPDGAALVVVEVKTRRSGCTVPEAALTATKQARLSRLASKIQRASEYSNLPLRFDVVAIVWPEAGEPTVRHIPGAFQAR